MRALPRLVLAVLLAAAAGCSNNRAAGTTPPTQIVPSYTVAAGQTTTLYGPTTIVSAGPVKIAGTIALAPGARFAVIAPSVDVSGTITSPAGPALSSAVPNGTLPALRAPKILIISDEISVGSSASIANLDDGRGILLAAQSPGGTVTIGGLIQAADGASAKAVAPTGTAAGAQPGANVEIGTPDAISEGEAVAAAAGQTAPAFAPDRVTLSGNVGAGRGGSGYNDINGTIGGRTVSLIAGDGAPGGSVTVVARTIDIAGAILVAGSGGTGGLIGTNMLFLKGGTAFSTPVDGSLLEPTGLNLVASTGGGGAGGSVTLAGIVTGRSTAIQGGYGAAPGSFEYAHAGNGGPGGKGGTTNITLGGYGPNGTPRPPPLKRSRVSVSLTGGGSGGPSNLDGVNGGAAGSVVIAGAGLADANITLIGYSNSGDGYGSCTANPPTAKGTNAGTPATLTTGHQPYTATTSFNGGSGGDGTTDAGSGSLGGIDDTSMKIGSDGPDGSLCGAAGTTSGGASPNP